MSEKIGVNVPGVDGLRNISCEYGIGKVPRLLTLDEYFNSARTGEDVSSDAIIYRNFHFSSFVPAKDAGPVVRKGRMVYCNHSEMIPDTKNLSVAEVWAWIVTNVPDEVKETSEVAISIMGTDISCKVVKGSLDENLEEGMKLPTSAKVRRIVFDGRNKSANFILIVEV